MIRAFMAVLALLAIVLITLGPCESEDSVMCYWDGGTNGTGTSYISITETVAITFTEQD